MGLILILCILVVTVNMSFVMYLLFGVLGGLDTTYREEPPTNKPRFIKGDQDG